MNKLKLMSQKTMQDVILYAAESEPGITSEKLYKLVKDWLNDPSQLEGLGAKFDAALLDCSGKLRCTNKCWYYPGAKHDRKTRDVTVDPRQTRMDW